MRIPGDHDELVATFGDASAYIGNTAMWESMYIVSVPSPSGLLLFAEQPVRSIRCHRLAAPYFATALGNLRDAGSSKLEYNGSYCFRVNRRNPKALSMHAWGIAIDFNASTCPLGSSPSRQNPLIVHAMIDAGFHWLDHENDPMHFQLAFGV